MQADEQRMEQWLDSALRHYGQAEARPGLAEPVLARLRAERQRETHARKWWGLAASMAAAAVMATLWLGRSAPDRMPKGPAVTNSAAVRAPDGLGTKTVDLPPAATGRGARGGHRRKTDRPVPPASANQLPRLQEFPSREMTEQYKLMAAYVERTPKDEVSAVIAQQKSSSDLKINDLEIAPLNHVGTTSESGERN